MKISFRLLIASLAFLFYNCSSGDAAKQDDKSDSNSHKIKSEEVIQGGSYTYIRGIENDKEVWIAVSKSIVEQGKEYFYSKFVEMKDFHSKELDKTFGSILFVEDLSEKPIEKKTNTPMTTGRQQIPMKEGVKVEKAPGGITISELFSDKQKWNGKKVKIAGEVVKFRADIMKKNWVHIQDGTNASGSFDLTITTMEMLNEGDKLIFEGTIALDKNFGAGYYYDLIMEDAKVVK
jgi:hypothetical protein